LQCKRKPAKAPLTKVGTGFAFGRALNVTLCGNRGVRRGTRMTRWFTLACED
jgi:hypothetical protein